MTCFVPIKANRSPDGKITFPTGAGYRIGDIELPCGRCNGCRIAKSKEWAIRCVHEAKTHSSNDFITLTYNNDHLPSDHGLHHLHFQKFIRKLRNRVNDDKKKFLDNKELNPEYTEIRYYMCGEYGKATEENDYIARPHFHAILFGYQYQDRKPHVVRRGHQTYLSELLSQDWGKGFIETSDVTFKSAAYVARYIIKKQKKDSENLTIFSPETGAITGQRIPEYTHMSLKPGIGQKYYYDNIMDIFPGDFVMIEAGRKLEVPKYYKESLKREHPILAEKLRLARVARAKESKDNTPGRLQTRQYIQQLKIDKLKREI